MTYTPAKIVAAAGQRDFVVPFPFINRSHVEVLVNGTAATVLEWVDGTTLRLATPLAGGASVVIRRVTPIDEALVQFQNGAILTQEDLNLAVQQLLYKQQEVTALYTGALSDAQVRLAENLGIVTNPSAVADMLAIEVLGSDVLETFQQRIADIDLNAENITSTALSLNGLQADHDNLVSIVDALASTDPGAGLATLITNETNARIDADNALVSTIALIGAKSADSLSFILDLSKVRVSPTETLATRLSALSASDANAVALITSADTARINGDNALAASLNTLGARVTTAEAAIVTEQNARATAIAAEASARTALAARVTTAEAAITNESTARASADSAFTQQFALLGAKNGAGTAWILDQNTVQVGGGVTLGTRLSGIDASLASNAAAIVTEQTARASADSALSSQITTLTSTVNGNTASITSVQSSVNGLNLKYGVSLNSNGHITGFVQNNNGSTGSFTVVADVFSIIAPGGGTPVTPFSVTAEGVRINGNLIVNGSIINEQFNLTTMVKKANLSWSGSQTPSPGSTVVVSEVSLGDIGKEGSVLIEYQVTASGYIGQTFGTYAGLPLTTTYLADGSVKVRVVDGSNNVLNEVSLTGAQYGSSGAATYDIGGFGQKVVELTGGAKTGLKLQLVITRGNTDTGFVNEGDYYTRSISGTYTVTAASAKAKWTFI